MKLLNFADSNQSEVVQFILSQLDIGKDLKDGLDNIMSKLDDGGKFELVKAITVLKTLTDVGKATPSSIEKFIRKIEDKLANNDDDNIHDIFQSTMKGISAIDSILGNKIKSDRPQNNNNRFLQGPKPY